MVLSRHDPNHKAKPVVRGWWVEIALSWQLAFVVSSIEFMGNDMGMRKEPVLWVISVTTPTQEVLSTGVSEYSALPVV